MKKNFIIGFIGFGLIIGMFILFTNNSSQKNNQELNDDNRIARKEKLIRKNKESEKNEKKKKEEKYLELLRKKLRNNFPKGTIKEKAVSYCGSTLLKKNNKTIIPKGEKVTILNYSKHGVYNRKTKKSRYIIDVQVFFNGEMYCINSKKIWKKVKIIVIEGGVAETSIYFRYVLFPNGKFLDILHRAPFYPNDWNYEYIAGIGNYTITKSAINLCDYDNFLYPYSNFPKGIKCITLKRKGKKWKYTEGNRMITYGLYEY